MTISRLRMNWTTKILSTTLVLVLVLKHTSRAMLQGKSPSRFANPKWSKLPLLPHQFSLVTHRLHFLRPKVGHDQLTLTTGPAFTTLNLATPPIQAQINLNALHQAPSPILASLLKPQLSALNHLKTSLYHFHSHNVPTH